MVKVPPAVLAPILIVSAVPAKLISFADVLNKFTGVVV